MFICIFINARNQPQVSSLIALPLICLRQSLSLNLKSIDSGRLPDQWILVTVLSLPSNSGCWSSQIAFLRQLFYLLSHLLKPIPTFRKNKIIIYHPAIAMLSKPKMNRVWKDPHRFKSTVCSPEIFIWYYVSFHVSWEPSDTCRYQCFWRPWHECWMA